MGLLSIFQRKKQTAAKPAKAGRSAKAPVRQAPAAPPADNTEAYREMRARARRRLMGATVLLLMGVIGFPLLFETQPRPIPVDLPIEIPSRNGAPVVDAAPAPAAATHGRTTAHANASAAANANANAGATALTASVASAPSVSYDPRPSAPLAAALPPSAGQVGSRPSGFSSLAAALTPGALHGGDGTAASVAAASGAQAAAYVKPKPAKPSQPAPAVAMVKPTPVPAPLHVPPTLPPPPATNPANAATTANGTAATTPPSSGDAAAALLAGKPAPKPTEAAAEGGRFVVQIGAFADDAKMHETRGKVEKLGLKTYTQAVDTPSGKRVRVRVGPFTTKAEADKVAARIKGDGLPAAVLAL